MKQPPFWLTVNNRYVIENFDSLLKYVKLYTYIKDEETDDGDFSRTYHYLKDVADGYAAQIAAADMFAPPEFDIPVEKVIRILGAALLTSKKMGIDDYSSLTALINLLILNNRNLGADTLAQYLAIVGKCIRRCPIRSICLSWSELEEERFMIGVVEAKVASTDMGLPATPSAPCIYEHRGLLTLDDNGMTLTHLNRTDAAKARLKTELTTSVGLQVKSPSPAAADTVEELIDLYPHIAGDFDAMKPAAAPTLKRYDDTEPFIARVTNVYGVKVEVETVDPDYCYERGNVLIDNIAFIPKDAVMQVIRPGDYLPVCRYGHENLAFRIHYGWVAEFVEDYANAHIDEEVPAIVMSKFREGSRWLSALGLQVYVFDNEIEEDGLTDEFQRALEEGTVCTLRIHSTSTTSSGNCVVKARFMGLDNDDADTEAFGEEDDHEFTRQAFDRLLKVFFDDVKDQRPEADTAAKPLPIERADVHLLALLIYQLALGQHRGDTPARMRQLIAAMLLMRMAGNEADAEFIRRQLDYQRALAMFARGISPGAIPAQGHQTELPEVAELDNQAKIIDLIHDYKEYIDADHNLTASINHTKSLDEIFPLVFQLVRASNSLVGRIDRSEINRIKKAICANLGVADQYKDIFTEGSNFGVESDFLEFKASCVIPPENQRTSSLTRDMELQKWNILKVICAFLNSTGGGELLIGVADSGFASGISNDLTTLFRERLISEPTADRLRTYLKYFVDNSFTTTDGSVSGTAITAGRVQIIIEQPQGSTEILRVKVSPYPWDVVKISAPGRPEGFSDTYVRTSGASTPLSRAGVREVKLRKLRSADKNYAATARILQAIDDKAVVEIRNYSGANGVTDRRLEPFKVLSNNKAFLAYDLGRRDIRMFKFSRFRPEDVKITTEKWKNQKKHIDRGLDIFGILGTDAFTPARVRVKLTDYARSLLLEESPAGREEAERCISPNPDPLDNNRFPWLLDTTVNSYAGIARFVLGLPHQTAIYATPALSEYILQ